MRDETQPLELDVTSVTHERLEWLAMSIFKYFGENGKLTTKDYKSLVVEHALEMLYNELVKEL